MIRMISLVEDSEAWEVLVKWEWAVEWEDKKIDRTIIDIKIYSEEASEVASETTTFSVEVL